MFELSLLTSSSITDLPEEGQNITLRQQSFVPRGGNFRRVLNIVQD